MTLLPLSIMVRSKKGLQRWQGKALRSPPHDVGVAASAFEILEVPVHFRIPLSGWKLLAYQIVNGQTEEKTSADEPECISSRISSRYLLA
ncbi:hypothetical protein E4U43_003692 [Claviceps pusilla]|uniref:Uncharacterized protein n=1 Tax=Claviceps pusilla TaxID=123648 RepID=A0A9P7NFF5_9HYPO|nr:hypothetical protein E4U43_003692 [Claviceps pusilla]